MQRSTVRALCKFLPLPKVAARISTGRYTTTFAQRGCRRVIDRTPSPCSNSPTPVLSTLVATLVGLCCYPSRNSIAIATSCFSLSDSSFSVKLGTRVQNLVRFPRRQSETEILASRSPPEREMSSARQLQLGTRAVPTPCRVAILQPLRIHSAPR